MQGNTKILVIPNKYKNTPDDLIDSSDEESQDWLGLIDKRSRKPLKFKSSSRGLSERKDFSGP